MGAVLVTGGLGLIGREVVKLLSMRGDSVVIADNASRGKAPAELHTTFSVDTNPEVTIDHVPMNLAFGCILNVGEERFDIDRVIHLAAMVRGVKGANEAEAQLMTTNMRIDANVLEWAAQNNVKKLVYASTACIYPVAIQTDPDAPGMKEDQAWPADPENGYGMAKLCAERLCQAYQRAGHNFVAVRMFNVYGPGEDYGDGSHAIPEIIRKVYEASNGGGPARIYGDGNQTRSFTYHTDAAKGIICALDRLLPLDGPVNIGSPERVSVKGLVELVAAKMGCAGIGVEYTGEWEGVRGRGPDAGKAADILGWKAETPLEYGIAKTIQWIREDMAGAAAG